jgi:hypothetical protein
MPIPDKTTLPRVASLSTQIPDIPRVNSRLLQIPGFQEFGAQQQEWWDIVRRRIAFEKGDTDQRIVATDNELASLTVTVTLIAGSGSALASRVTTLEAEVQTPTTGLLARVSTIESAYVDASGAYAQAISAITAELSGPSGSIFASVDSEATARASADSALSSLISSLTATVGGNTAAITSEATARANADSALSSLISSLTATVGGNTAAITSEATARANADSALSSLISSLTATVGGNTAAITSEATARASADGNLEGKYTLSVTAGNVVTGMNITSASGPGTNISEVTFQADRFRIYNGTIGQTMFDLTGSQLTLSSNVTIDGNLLVNGTINGTKIGAGQITGTLIAAGTITGTLIAAGTILAGNISVGQLSAITADLGTVTAGTLTAVSITAASITGTTSIDVGSGFFRTQINSSALTIGAGSLGTSYLGSDGTQAVFTCGGTTRRFEAGGGAVAGFARVQGAAGVVWIANDLGNTVQTGTMDVDGAATFGSTLQVGGNLRVVGDINGEDTTDPELTVMTGVKIELNPASANRSRLGCGTTASTDRAFTDYLSVDVNGVTRYIPYTDTL